jgi:hypothetical protein
VLGYTFHIKWTNFVDVIGKVKSIDGIHGIAKKSGIKELASAGRRGQRSDPETT